MTETGRTGKAGRAEVQDKPKRRKSALHRFIGAIFTAFFLGMLVLVVVNIYQWNSSGYDAMMQNLNSHYQTEMSSLMVRNGAVAVYTIAMFQLINSKFTQWISNSKREIQSLEASKHISFLQSVRNKAQQFNQHTKSNFVDGMLSGAFGHIKQIGCMLWASFIVLLFKFISVFAAILIYIFAGLLGALDGLVVRYVRTAEGGRESTFIFHKMTNVIIQLPIWLIIIYLISPVLINPMIVIALLALSFFVVFNIATSNLKKFL